ncbi:MAG TPA: PEP-CTERM sorting domain-containing protein [Pseudomonadales bacterium]|nr:PEP-CTERM sorting domain-containing protein [Pseudomonadales bacterium]
MKSKVLSGLGLGLVTVCLTANSVKATVVLYDQDFENPAAFVNDGGDVNIYHSVNTLYGNQPTGFTFAQAYTVETLHITGNQAFGHGYSDPSGTGGNYALGMLSSAQNDLLGLSFNIGSNDFLNVSMDISSIDLSTFGGPFVPSGAVPTFEFTLYDNPSGATGLGGGTILDVLQVSGTSSARDVFDWTNVLLPLDATGNTNGNVTLRIDLLSGGYAAMDNFRIAASDTAGDVGANPVSEPATMLLFGTGIVGLVGSRIIRKRK